MGAIGTLSYHLNYSTYIIEEGMHNFCEIVVRVQGSAQDAPLRHLC